MRDRQEYLDWYRSSDTGISSETIFEVMTGIPVKRHNVPLDRSDFGRCHRLLDKFPEWRERLPEVAARFPKWELLVRHWRYIEEAYEKADVGLSEFIHRLGS